MPGMGRTRCLNALAVCSLLTGCVTTSLSGGGNSVRLHGTFVDTTGIPLRGPVALRSRGFGVHKSNASISVGFISETAILLPADDEHCRIFLLGNTPAGAAALVDVLGRAGVPLEDICLDHAMEESP